MAQRLRGRATSAVAAVVAAACLAMAAGPAFADTVRNQEWWLNSLHLTQAWLSTRGSGVTVAVLNTGVDPAQPDLAGSVTTGRDFTGSGRAPGGQFWGANGTAVASLIAGHGHGPQDAAGIIGVAPQAKILSIRVTLEAGDPLLANAATVAALPRAIARGIGAAVRQGAQVIDLPLDPATLAGGNTPGGSPLERSAVEAALRKGVVLVAPAGDNGTGTDGVNYPAAYPGVISVGAFNSGFTKAAFSSHQRYVTLTAPGDGVIAANGTGGYAKLASTTAASAMVAGIAALIRAQFPALSPAQVEQALTSSTVFHPQAGQQAGSGAGTVDAAAALVSAARIFATMSASQGTARPVTPTPPAAPKVAVHTTSLWNALRYPVLGIAAILLLAVAILIWVRVRQRRELDARLAPLRAAAEAPRGARADGPPGLADDPLPPGVRRAPFDDPAFVPPSFQQQAFSAPPLGGPGLSSQGMSGPVLRNPVFGDPGENGSAYSRPAPARPPVQDPSFGTVAADSPALGGAGPSDTAAAEAAFLRGVPAPFSSAAAEAPAAGEAAPPGSPFGRPAAGDAAAPPLRTLGSAHRLNSVRAPKTTGHPPWGPAEKPEGELPWVDAPARPPAGRIVPPRRSFPPGADAEAGATPPGDTGGGPGRPADAGLGQFPDLEPPFPGAAGGPPGNLFGPVDEPEPAQRRVYAWNPSDTTEALPRIRPDDAQPN